jgi:hypothetical protein
MESSQMRKGCDGCSLPCSVYSLLILKHCSRTSFSVAATAAAAVPPQLEVLFKRSLHKLALDLALCHEADPQLIAAIRQRWGEPAAGW